MRLAAFVSLAFVMALAACGSFGATPEGPVGGDGADGGATNEGGPAGNPTDAGSGSETTPEAGGSWCQSQGVHDFCADFDDGRPLDQLFPDGLKGSTGTAALPSIQIDKARAVSPLGSLLFSVPMNPSSLQLFANVSLASASNGFSCTFEVAFDTPPAGYLGTLVWVQLGPDLFISLGDGLSVNRASGTVTGTAAFSLPGHAFTRMGLKVDTRAGKVTASRAGVDSVVALPAGTVSPTIHFGMLYPSGAPFAARYDNILCDKLP